MIQVHIIYKSGDHRVIAGGTDRQIACRAEDAMWKDMPRIASIHIAAHPEWYRESLVMAKLFAGVQRDIHFNQAIEREGQAEFDLYEIAKHPRRNASC